MGLNLKHVDNASEYNEENKKLKNDTLLGRMG